MSKQVIRNAECFSALCREPAAKYDAFIADPPYCSGTTQQAASASKAADKYQRQGTQKRYPDFEGEYRDQRSWIRWCTLWLGEARRVTRPGGRCFVFCDWRKLPSLSDALQAAGWQWRGVIAWDKVCAMPIHFQHRHQCEFVLSATNGKPKLPDPIGPWPGIYRFYQNPRTKLHVCAKPVELLTELLRSVPVGGHVCDPFAGSGSTLVAAADLGLNATGFELSQEYVAITRKRLTEHKRRAP